MTQPQSNFSIPVAAISGGSGLISSLATAKMAREDAREARQFYKDMSNTAYQRQIKDMRAAGVNPALLYAAGKGGGASSAMPALPSHKGVDLSLDKGISSGYAAAANRSQRMTEAKGRNLTDAQIRTEGTKQDVNSAAAAKARADAAVARSNDQVNQLEIQRRRLELPSLENEAAYQASDGARYLRAVQRASEAVGPISSGLSGLLLGGAFGRASKAIKSVQPGKANYPSYQKLERSKRYDPSQNRYHPKPKDRKPRHMPPPHPKYPRYD